MERLTKKRKRKLIRNYVGFAIKAASSEALLELDFGYDGSMHLVRVPTNARSATIAKKEDILVQALYRELKSFSEELDLDILAKLKEL